MPYLRAAINVGRTLQGKMMQDFLLLVVGRYHINTTKRQEAALVLLFYTYEFLIQKVPRSDQRNKWNIGCTKKTVEAASLLKNVYPERV